MDLPVGPGLALLTEEGLESGCAAVDGGGGRPRRLGDGEGGFLEE